MPSVFLLPLPPFPLSLQFPCGSSPSHPKLIASSSKPSLLAMKDRPPSSYDSVYVSPHHRLRSVISTPNYTSPASIGSKLRENQTAAAAALNRRSSANGAMAYYQTHQQQQLQQQEQFQKPKLQHTSAYDDGVSEEGSDREVELPPHPDKIKGLKETGIDDLGFAQPGATELTHVANREFAHTTKPNA